MKSLVLFTLFKARYRWMDSGFAGDWVARENDENDGRQPSHIRYGHWRSLGTWAQLWGCLDIPRAHPSRLRCPRRFRLFLFLIMAAANQGKTKRQARE